MSRVGHVPVEIPEEVEITKNGHEIQVEGPKGELTEEISSRLEVEIDGNEITITRPTDCKEDKSQHGLARSLVENMIEGVTEGFKRELELNGVGYRAIKKGENLELQVGYSHSVVIEPEGEVEFEVEDETIIVKGIDKQLVGEVASNIKDVRPPEPYNGKGIKYKDEKIRRKEGKTA